ncbi:MAG TPA: chalcone isomerase family protein [Burkholderiaceae bacterium]|nr:chalcone isomerase family protein [Burkholderiaceae bacterium]
MAWIHRGVLALCLWGAATWALSAELAGVRFESTAQLAGQSLVLNGAGLRTRFFFKVYAAGLYVSESSSQASAILQQSGPRMVRIVMLRDVSADTFIESLHEGLKNNHSEAQLAALSHQIEALGSIMRALGMAKKGDQIEFTYAPAVGTRIVQNGQARGAPIEGEAFFAAVLRVWIGEHPADMELKRALLGL